jgi:hypothetical protein
MTDNCCILQRRPISISNSGDHPRIEGIFTFSFFGLGKINFQIMIVLNNIEILNHLALGISEIFHDLSHSKLSFRNIQLFFQMSSKVIFYIFLKSLSGKQDKSPQRFWQQAFLSRVVFALDQC